MLQSLVWRSCRTIGTTAWASALQYFELPRAHISPSTSISPNSGLGNNIKVWLLESGCCCTRRCVVGWHTQISVLLVLDGTCSCHPRRHFSWSTLLGSDVDRSSSDARNDPVVSQQEDKPNLQSTLRSPQERHHYCYYLQAAASAADLSAFDVATIR